MEAGIELAQHFASEGLRLSGASLINAELKLAANVLTWLHLRHEDVVSLPCLYQHGPSAIRDKAKATKIAAILEDHGHLAPIEGGTEVDGKWRRVVWRLVARDRETA